MMRRPICAKCCEVAGGGFWRIQGERWQHYCPERGGAWQDFGPCTEPARSWWLFLVLGLIIGAALVGLFGCSSPKGNIQDAARETRGTAAAVRTDAVLIRQQASDATRELSPLVDPKPSGGPSVVTGALTRLGTIDAAAGRIEAAAGRVEKAADKIAENADHVHDDRTLWRTLLALAPWALGSLAVVALLFYSGMLPLVGQLVGLAFGVVGRVLGRVRSLVATWHPWDAAESIRRRRHERRANTKTEA